MVYAKPPFAGPHQVLDYVGRYTHRVAIANQGLLDMDDGHVRFRYTDDRAQASQTTMTLDATAFIRRVLLHVLPSGFHRIRYDGPPGFIVTGVSTWPAADTSSAPWRGPNGSTTPRPPPTIVTAMRRSPGAPCASVRAVTTARCGSSSA